MPRVATNKTTRTNPGRAGAGRAATTSEMAIIPSPIAAFNRPALNAPTSSTSRATAGMQQGHRRDGHADHEGQAQKAAQWFGPQSHPHALADRALAVNAGGWRTGRQRGAAVLHGGQGARHRDHPEPRCHPEQGDDATAENAPRIMALIIPMFCRATAGSNRSRGTTAGTSAWKSGVVPAIGTALKNAQAKATGTVIIAVGTSSAVPANTMLVDTSIATPNGRGASRSAKPPA